MTNDWIIEDYFNFKNHNDDKIKSKTKMMVVHDLKNENDTLDNIMYKRST